MRVRCGSTARSSTRASTLSPKSRPAADRLQRCRRTFLRTTPRREAADEIELKLHLPDGAAETLPLAALLKDVQPRTSAARRDLLRHRRSAAAASTAWHCDCVVPAGSGVQTLKTAGTRAWRIERPARVGVPARSSSGAAPRIDLALLKDSPLPALLSQDKKSAAAASGLPSAGSAHAVGYQATSAAGSKWRWIAVRSKRCERAGVPSSRCRARTGTQGRSRRGPAVGRAASRGNRKISAGHGADSGKQGRARLSAGQLSARGHPTKAAARGFVDALNPDMSVGVALRAIVAHGLDVLLANTDGLRDAHDPEFVHQARVAMRRMRSAIRLLDRRHADLPAALADELRWVGRFLGAARDWDVLTDSDPAGSARHGAGETRTACARAAGAGRDETRRRTHSRGRCARHSTLCPPRAAVAGVDPVAAAQGTHAETPCIAPTRQGASAVVQRRPVLRGTVARAAPPRAHPRQAAALFAGRDVGCAAETTHRTLCRSAV